MNNWRGPYDLHSKKQDLWTTLTKTWDDFWFFIRMMFVLGIAGAIIVGIVGLFSG